LELLFIKVFRSHFEAMCSKGYRKGGIIINGKNPWDIQVKDTGFYTRVINRGSLGVGESYVDGLWDTKDIVEMTRRTMKSKIYRHYLNPWNRFLHFLECYFFNLQTKEQAWEVGHKHYDLGEAT